MKRTIETKTNGLLRGLSCLTCLGALALGCSSNDDASTGSLTVLLEAEDVIVEGLEPGDDVENIKDGWAVSFDKYLATVGHLDLHLSSDESVEAESEDVYVIDLTDVPASGEELWMFEELEAGRWEFNYETPGAAHGGMRHESVEEDDFDFMVENDFTYHIEGSLEKEDGESCPPSDLADVGDLEPNGNTSGGNDCYDNPNISFTISAQAETVFGPCEIDEVPGVSVPEGGAQTVAISIHGDHIFFNGFPEGDEGGISRQAQWLADCDLNLDGTVTQEELEAVTPADLPVMEDYQFGGAPIEPTDMYQYVRAQLKTQGHYQGEGECPVDGVAHEHGHDEDDHDHDH